MRQENSREIEILYCTPTGIEGRFTSMCISLLCNLYSWENTVK